MKKKKNFLILQGQNNSFKSFLYTGIAGLFITIIFFISPNLVNFKNSSFELLFDSNHSIEERILKEQFSE